MRERGERESQCERERVSERERGEREKEREREARSVNTLARLEVNERSGVVSATD